MINHARTLLVNHEATEDIYPYEEYIDPAYRKLQLPAEIRFIWERFFGRNSPRWARNYRARELLTILHSGDLESYILDLDNRITYLPFLQGDGSKPKDLPPLVAIPEAVQSTTQTGYRQLFGGRNVKYAEFERLWGSTAFTDRLGGIVLAFIYKLEELRCEVEKCKVLDVVDNRLPGGAAAEEGLYLPARTDG
jgi:hypothetical protein